MKNNKRQIQIENLGGQEVRLWSNEDVWMPTQFGRELGEIITQRANGEVKKTIEMGVGSGVLSILCGKLGGKVVGLDINPKVLEVAKGNWKENGLEEDSFEIRYSDLFSAMKTEDEGAYTLLISNPPTFPARVENRFRRESRDEWEAAGTDGREVLDAVITQGGKYLAKGGKLLVIATSKQGWKLTKELMDEYWQKWSVLKEMDLPLADYYKEFISLWEAEEAADGEKRVSEKDGEYYQRLYFIEAIKE